MPERSAAAVTRPPVAVVVATLGPATGAPRAIRSLLRSSYSPLEILVVDQRSGPSPDALQEAAADPRVRIVPTADRGLAAARNAGVRASSAPIVAFTDDDCAAEPGWVEGLVEPFGLEPDLAVVFGSVQPAVFDRRAGLVQGYVISRSCTVRGAANQWWINGIGACMAVRRSAFEALGGFDEHFGVGAPLCAAEDTELVLRALTAGFAVGETPGAAVTHFGFRTWSEARPMIRRYMFGLGAMHAKMIRLNGWRAAKPLGTLGWRWVASRPATDLGPRPPRLLRLAAFLRGLRAGWALGLDSRTGHFVRPGPAATPTGPYGR